MKKIAFVCIMLLSAERAFAQLSFYGAPYQVLLFTGGVHQTIINNPGFDAWTRQHYHETRPNVTGIECDFSVITRNYEYGLHYSSNNPLGYGGPYIGRRLTSRSSKVSSWLNFEIGNAFAYYDELAPVHYIRTPDQQGKQLRLRYDATYIGLSTRNYFNDHHFRIGGHKGISINAGFFFSVLYEPFKDGAWKYGYQYSDDSDSDDTQSYFNSVTIHNIPKLNNFFMDAGIFISFGALYTK